MGGLNQSWWSDINSIDQVKASVVENSRLCTELLCQKEAGDGQSDTEFAGTSADYLLLLIHLLWIKT